MHVTKNTCKRWQHAMFPFSSRLYRCLPPLQCVFFTESVHTSVPPIPRLQTNSVKRFLTPSLMSQFLLLLTHNVNCTLSTINHIYIPAFMRLRTLFNPWWLENKSWPSGGVDDIVNESLHFAEHTSWQGRWACLRCRQGSRLRHLWYLSYYNIDEQCLLVI